MRRLPVVLIVIVAFGVGFLVGAKVIGYYAAVVESETRLNSTEARCDLAIRSLKLSRANPTNAIEFLETELDLTVIELGSVLDDSPLTDWAQTDVRLLTSVSEYRSRFPRATENAERDRRVAETLSLIE